MANDASELRDFGVELGNIGPKVQREVEAVVSKGALNIKNTMREDMAASSSFGALSSTIDFSLNVGSDGIEAEIGPGKRSGGSSRGLDFGANIAYFGTSRGGGGTVDVENGLRKELPGFMEHLGRVTKDVL